MQKFDADVDVDNVLPHGSSDGEELSTSVLINQSINQYSCFSKTGDHPYVSYT